MASPGRNSSLTVSLCALALLASAAVFVVRTARQPHYEPCDFAVYYTPARAWLSGGNPYDCDTALSRWTAAGGRADIMPDYDGMPADWFMPIIGVPQAWPLMAPLAALPVRPALFIWYTLMAALLLAQTAALASMIGSALWHPKGLILLACTLLLAPVHEIFGYGQPSGPVISLMIIGFWAMSRHREVTGGVLFALAAAFKPQLVAPFVLYYILIRRRRFALIFTAGITLLTLVAIIPMSARGTPWLDGWLRNMSDSSAAGGPSSTLPTNDGRDHLLNLQVVLHGFMRADAPVNALALFITLVLAAMIATVRNRGSLPGPATSNSPRNDEMLLLCAVCVLALLPVYHRFYDAALLVVPLAWAIAHVRDRPRWAWPVLVFALSFVIPFPVADRAIGRLGIDPSSASGWWWDGLVEPWRTWMLLAGIALILRAMSRPASPTELDEKRSDSMRQFPELSAAP